MAHPNAAVVRVLIADAYPVVRAGLRAVVEAAGDLIVVVEAADGDEAARLAERVMPDVLIAEVVLPGLSGIEISQRLRAAGSPTRVLFLTSSDREDHVRDAINAGAAGYLLKGDDTVDLADAVRRAARGQSGWLSRPLVERLIQHLSPGSRGEEGNREQLSQRELDVLVELAAGLDNREIATELSLAEGTVKNHVTAIYNKLGIHSRAQACAWAWQHRLAGDPRAKPAWEAPDDGPKREASPPTASSQRDVADRPCT